MTKLKQHLRHFSSLTLLFLTAGIQGQAEAVTPEVGFTQLDLPKGVSSLNPQMCINGYNLNLNYNPIAGLSGDYGSEQFLYNGCN